MKATDYLKGFSLTNEIVPIEELHSFVQMQKLVRNYPIPFFTDGYYFQVDEIGDAKMYYADIVWAERIGEKQSCFHLKDGSTFILPFGTRGIEQFMTNAQGSYLVQINNSTFVALTAIEKVSRQVVYLKGCDTPFKITETCLKNFTCDLNEFLNTAL